MHQVIGFRKLGEIMWSDIATAVQTIGFNAVFLLIMAYFLKYVFDRLQDTIDNFTGAIQENTKAVIEMSAKIKDHFGKDDEQ